MGEGVSSCASGNSVFLFGGQLQGQRASNHFFELRAMTNSHFVWTLLEVEQPLTNRTNCSMISTGNRILIYGGEFSIGSILFSIAA